MSIISLIDYGLITCLKKAAVAYSSLSGC